MKEMSITAITTYINTNYNNERIDLHFYGLITPSYSRHYSHPRYEWSGPMIRSRCDRRTTSRRNSPSTYNTWRTKRRSADEERHIIMGGVRVTTRKISIEKAIMMI